MTHLSQLFWHPEVRLEVKLSAAVFKPKTLLLHLAR